MNLNYKIIREDAIRENIRLKNKEKAPEIHENIELAEAFKRIRKFYDSKNYFKLKKWFLLDGVKLERKDPSGNLYQPEVKFTTCYVKPSKNVKNVVKEALNEEPRLDKLFSDLETKLKTDRNIPLTCLIDCCEIVEKDFWNLLEGEHISSKTSSKSIKIPEKSAKLDKIAIWILTEGHIPISHPSIEINQTRNNENNLNDLSSLINDLFQADIINFSNTDCWSGKSGRRLIISSAPVRQFFVLRYDIPLGKKSKKIRLNLEVSEENYRNLLPAFIKTEGCFSSSREVPRFEFKIQDKNLRDACSKCLEKIGCSPKNSETETWNTGIYSIEDLLRIHHFLLKEDEIELSRELRKLLDNSNILEALRKKRWCPLIDKARSKLSESQPNKKFVERHNLIFTNHQINHQMVSSWALGKVPPRFSAALIAGKACEKEKDDIFEPHIQSYINLSSVVEYDRPRS